MATTLQMAENATSNSKFRARMLILVGIFLFLYAVALTISPAVRARSWDVDYRWSHWAGVIVWAAGMVFAELQYRKHAPDSDPYLFPIVALLSGWGLLTIYRLLPAFGIRQTIWLALAILGFAWGMRLPKDLSFLKRYKYLWLTSGLVLTGLTLIFGTNPAGAGPPQWLGCCGVYFQPSEPLKLLLIAYLAAYLADRLPAATGAGLRALFSLLAPTLIMTALALLLLVVQRDLGTATIFLLIYASLIYLGTGKRWVIVASLVGLLVVGVVGYTQFGVVQVRVNAWLNPWADPSGASYQIVQSLIATAAGEILGRGPGLGNPGLVPLAHSDFIFTAIAEEFGLIGVIALLSVIALLLHRGLQIALHTRDPYRRYLAAGLTAHLAIQSILIVAGNLKVLPLTGVTLPFVSYGGSSLITSYLSLLLLTLISTERSRRPASPSSATPTLAIGTTLLAGFGVVALFGGWWAVIQSANLLQRGDNPRPAISDRFVYRGNFQDRNGTGLTLNRGAPGTYSRFYLYPSLSHVVGYTHPTFGQAGLEAALDDYLRGLTGLPLTTIWENQLLYGQHPPGLDIRLSIDLELQNLASDLLGDIPGAVVLLNARSGEILAMVSQPGFDANALDASWQDLINNPDAPLLNRAAQGAYPPGTTFAPLLWAAFAEGQNPPPLPGTLSYRLADRVWECATLPQENTWAQVLQAGCPGPVARLGKLLEQEKLNGLYQNSGLFRAPEILLPTITNAPPAAALDSAAIALGQDMLISPLQLALAIAPVSNQGVRPFPRLAIAYNVPGEGWKPLPGSGKETVRVFLPQTAEQTANLLKVPNTLFWKSVSLIENAPENAFTWYTGGTLPSWAGAPMVVVVLLETGNVESANAIGQGMLESAILP